MRKRVKPRPKIDYRQRWPTQQTLVESQVSVGSPEGRWRGKFRVGWFSRFRRRSPRVEPGKSTHPYDTGIDEQAESDSASSSTVTDDRRGCWRMFARVSSPSSSPTPVSEVRHVSEEGKSEAPSTPVRFLRHLATSPRKSPFPRSRTTSPFDIDKATVKSTGSRIQTPAPPPTAMKPSTMTMTPLSRLRSLIKGVFRRRSADWERAARS